MVNGLVRHEAKWLAPAPLWRNGSVAESGGGNGSAWQPAILRFDNDLFMDEVLAVLAYAPDRLTEWVAKPEAWHAPQPSPSAAPQLQTAQPVTALSKKLKRQQAKREGAAAGAAKQEPSAGGLSASGEAEKPLFKLYQPAHQRYYLVAASLVCQQFGMPDRRVDAGRQESTGFVIRRVVYADADEASAAPYDATGDKWSEYAYVATPDGFGWKLIPTEQRTEMQSGEERLPLFSLNFTETAGQPRRMLAGLIPVGKREAYLSAMPYVERETAEAAGEAKLEKARQALLALFDEKVISPWAALIEQAATLRRSIDDANEKLPSFDLGSNAETKKQEERIKILKSSRDQIQTVSWYVLLDFSEFLQRYFGELRQAIINDDETALATDEGRTLYRELKKITIAYSHIREYYPVLLSPPATYYDNKNLKVSLIDALKVVEDFRSRLEETTGFYNGESLIGSTPWPGFSFPLTDPGLDDLKNGPLPKLAVTESGLADWEVAIARLDELSRLMKEALPDTAETPPEITLPQVPRAPLDPRDGWFVIRCMFERPNCGPLHPAVMSRPTEKFQMAAFFDPDAPARQVRISLPMDISPAGLRKFRKSATLMMSDMLCGKVGEIRKLTFGDLVLSVLPWPFHKDLPEPEKTGPCTDKNGSAGMYCSLSIPIVTLAALILLIIIVALFDMFFRWLPFLFTCFPIPGMKGKKT
jgi:hypothetical protein